ncbi:hypothetical protein [Shimia sp.]|uniref:hypothetical protein n=1 Tax=Shimia sp. TaxID=1954381 RepID=UPI003299C76E
MSGLKKGDTCWSLVWSEDGRIEWWEYVLRTIQTRKEPLWPGDTSGYACTYGYWWPKLKGTTWGKVSRKHGDLGWLPGAWSCFREKLSINAGRPYPKTQLGALRQEIAEVRAEIKERGPDSHDWSCEIPASWRLKKLLAAQKRLRKTKNDGGKSK